MATRRKRRSELARAAEARREARRRERARRRRRNRRLLTLALVALLVALLLWVVLRDRGSEASAAGPGNYADAVALSHHHAPTAEGAR